MQSFHPVKYAYVGGVTVCWGDEKMTKRSQKIVKPTLVTTDNLYHLIVSAHFIPNFTAPIAHNEHGNHTCELVATLTCGFLHQRSELIGDGEIPVVSFCPSYPQKTKKIVVDVLKRLFLNNKYEVYQLWITKSENIMTISKNLTECVEFKCENVM